MINNYNEETENFKNMIVTASLTEDAIAKIEKIGINDDNLIFVTVPEPYASMEFFENVWEQMKSFFPSNQVLITREIDVKKMTIEEINELIKHLKMTLEEMNKDA